MRYLRWSATVLFLGVSVGSIATDAQVVAKQGTSTVTDFRSPMILEIPLPNLVGQPVGATSSLGPLLAGYSCDGVSIHALLVRLARRKDGDALEIQVSGSVKVPSSIDRLVNIDFVIVSDAKTLGAATVKRLDAEEDRTTYFKTRMLLSEEKLREAFDLTPTPILQLTVTVVENG